MKCPQCQFEIKRPKAPSQIIYTEDELLAIKDYHENLMHHHNVQLTAQDLHQAFTQYYPEFKMSKLKLIKGLRKLGLPLSVVQRVNDKSARVYNFSRKTK